MKRIIVIIIAITVLAAIIVLVIFSIKKNQIKPADKPAVTNPPAAATPPPPPPANVAELTAASEIKVLVKKFTEIYGSYSTDNNFQNLENLKPLMTANLIELVNKIIAEGNKSKDFFGVTTRLISQTIEAKTDIRQVIRVKTQRQETSIGASAKIFYQDLVLTLVNTNRGWLVDQAKWQ